jgi:hypothetical protein
MIIKINNESTYVSPFGIIIHLYDHQICIPKSTILNCETFNENGKLELADWFYTKFIEPVENIYKMRLENEIFETAGMMNAALN